MSTATGPEVGGIWTLVAHFYSDAAETVLADPDDVVLEIRDPFGVTLTPTPVSVSVGIWSYDWEPESGGDYEIRWSGDGAVTAAQVETISVGGWPPGSLIGPNYLTAAQLKATLAMTGTSFADADVSISIGAASRAVDTITGRRFWLDADADQVRYYTPHSLRLLQIDDLVEMTSVAIDRSGNGNFSESWTRGTDYVLEPFNAPSEQPARPYETLRVRRLSGRWLPDCIEQSVKVTGQFGWATVPDDVTAATSILAAKLVRRQRDAPFGIVMGIDSGVAMRIARTDPDVYTLLHDYTRHEPFV